MPGKEAAPRTAGGGVAAVASDRSAAPEGPSRERTGTGRSVTSRVQTAPTAEAKARQRRPACEGGAARLGTDAEAASPAAAAAGTGVAAAPGSSATAGLTQFEQLLRRAQGEDLEKIVRAFDRRREHLYFNRLPERIILLRHGEFEGALSHKISAVKGDANQELTPRGLRESIEAGVRLRELLGKQSTFVVSSPYERAIQTLMALCTDQERGLREEQMSKWHICSQIREKEMGNFQSLGEREKAKVEQKIVGPFYYRRPNAESSADVFDRVSAFMDELLESTLRDSRERFDAVLIVTHGLVIRLILMKLFKWSIETFEAVWNIGRGCHLTLRKDEKSHSYVLCAEESYPPQVPPATRNVWLVKKSKEASADTEDQLSMLRAFRKRREWEGLTVAQRENSAYLDYLLEDDLEAPDDAASVLVEIDRGIDELRNRQILERSEPYHVNAYLTLPQPRTEQWDLLKDRLVPGHVDAERWRPVAWEHVEAVDFDDVEFIDWWGPSMSYQAKMLRAIHTTDNIQQGVLRRMSTHFLEATPDEKQTGVTPAYSASAQGRCSVLSADTA